MESLHSSYLRFVAIIMTYLRVVATPFVWVRANSIWASGNRCTTQLGCYQLIWPPTAVALMRHIACDGLGAIFIIKCTLLTPYMLRNVSADDGWW